MRNLRSFRLRYPGCLAIALSLVGLVGCAGVSSNSQNQGNNLAAGQLAVSPTALNFGNVTVGGKKSLNANLTAGASNISVSSAAWKGEGYSVSGITFPVTVPAGQSVPFTVTFAPQTSGNSAGGVSFDSDATDSPTAQTFNGAGTESNGGHSVALSWNASTSQNVTGYNIYRGVASGGPYSRVNSTLNTTTDYSDSAIQSGQTYYYVTTAVSSQGVESAYSNQAAAIIP